VSPTPARGDTQVGPPPDYDEDAPTRVHDVEAFAEPGAPQRRDVTVVATAPHGASATVPAPARRAAAQWTPPAAPTAEQRREAPAPEEVETRPEAELPVSPRRPAAPVQPPHAAAASYADELDSGSEFEEFQVRKGGAFGTVVVSILLVAAIALVGASLALENTADPRPLLEKLMKR
jgi:hypothetical protein